MSTTKPSAVAGPKVASFVRQTRSQFDSVVNIKTRGGALKSLLLVCAYGFHSKYRICINVCHSRGNADHIQKIHRKRAWDLTSENIDGFQAPIR